MPKAAERSPPPRFGDPGARPPSSAGMRVAVPLRVRGGRFRGQARPAIELFPAGMARLERRCGFAGVPAGELRHPVRLAVPPHSTTLLRNRERLPASIPCVWRGARRGPPRMQRAGLPRPSVWPSRRSRPCHARARGLGRNRAASEGCSVYGCPAGDRRGMTHVERLAQRNGPGGTTLWGIVLWWNRSVGIVVPWDCSVGGMLPVLWEPRCDGPECCSVGMAARELHSCAATALYVNGEMGV